jgi:hypothetical protein
MDKQIELEDDWDPDKFKDELCEDAWRESGAKTLEEFIKWHTKELRKFAKDVEASGLSYVDYILAERRAEAQTNA